MRLLVTGGAGFIGSNFIHHVLKHHSDVDVTNFDLLTYAGNLDNLADVSDSPRYRFVRGDVADAVAVGAVLQNGFDAIVHFAAESHVDRSLEDATLFVRTNVLGTQTLLEEARRFGIKRFLHISTDEVYGSAAEGVSFAEGAPLAPSSPYAASKAAADLLVLSAVRTYGFPASILRCSNNFGPYQFPEKLIPLMLANALDDGPLPLYGDGLNVRDWLYVEDCCRAIALAVRRGRLGEVYNIGGVAQRTNLDLVRTLLPLVGKPESLITFVQDRPGHDRRYALDSGKARRELGWSPGYAFDEALARTVEWYRTHSSWLARCRSGDYREYYHRHYERRGETLDELVARKTAAGSAETADLGV